jgi:hypothetical protein
LDIINNVEMKNFQDAELRSNLIRYTLLWVISLNNSDNRCCCCCCCSEVFISINCIPYVNFQVVSAS